MANEFIDKLAKALAETLPQSLRSARDDLEKNFRSVLQSSLSKLDLVTREEFEVQQAVLARTRDKLAALEARLAAIESGPSKKKADTTTTQNLIQEGLKGISEKADKLAQGISSGNMTEDAIWKGIDQMWSVLWTVRDLVPVVTINKAKKHNYQNGDFVRIFDIDNMPELSGGGEVTHG